ncbi:GlxA family transcriptional regulator [Phytoactinopolyspora halotolerans]|uniref:Helix-turn-helix domain-containing protein n=1 Tax=Phytoactinopolyspora halotolerans TaxID=1981512 RepID=A0A6L9SCI3_9ACTN|nr:helix-turn-helix domain-containing protein [Phytoactinopolyspora halotolerans]NEE02278.1 helix-turn-helix domain-containing protein [Phytoactinopolyspora halotolerans]
MSTLAVLIWDPVRGFDLSVVTEVFGSAYPLGIPDGSAPLYDIRLCGGSDTRPSLWLGGTTALTVGTTHTWHDAADADTVAVLSPTTLTSSIPAEIVSVLRRAHERGARIMSFCNGAAVLAEAGLLDGRRAAIHWTHTAQFAARYPAVRVDAAVLYIDDGDIVTTAGGAAGIDMCLHLVQHDHGSAVAAQTAQHALLPFHRSGDQAQIVDHAPAERGDRLEPLLRWLEDHLDRDLSLATIADQSSTSVRTLNRWFRARTGTTPMQWLIRRRLQRAQELLETTDLTVDEIARRSGFGSAVALRQHFRRVLSTTPTAHRRALYTPPRQRS